jgi:hypothetical protein
MTAVSFAMMPSTIHLSNDALVSASESTAATIVAS